jgi:AAA15 family ATPase/GTPase
MLLRFTVENVLSFREETEFSMLATSDDKHESHLLTGAHGERVLRGAGVYGANGHGKTKFVEAIASFKEIVCSGVASGKKIPTKPFKYSKNKENPSKYVINFEVAGVAYEYGLLLVRSHILEEWLFGRPNKREVQYFERVSAVTKGGGYETTIEIGPRLRAEIGKRKVNRDFIDFVAEGTRENQPFLFEAVERNVVELKPVMDWFKHCLVIVQADSQYNRLHNRAKDDKGFVKFVSEFMQMADIGIDHIKLQEVAFDLENHNLSILDDTDILQDLEEGEAIQLGDQDGVVIAIKKNKGGEMSAMRFQSVHKNSSGDLVEFSMDEESAGTRRLLNLMPILIDIQTGGKTYIIDELDRKLHPLLAYRFIEALLGRASDGQVVFTTHNTHLIDVELLRRDEIWFVEKDRDGVSRLSSLAQMKVRTDLNLQRGYMNGRFGGVPRGSSFEALPWAELLADSLSNRTDHRGKDVN